jgi:xylan 1,4-beta-xylosidase
MSQVGYAGTGVRTLQRWTTFAVLLLLSQQGQSRAQKPLTSDPAQSSVAVERQPVADLGNNYYRNPSLAGNYADNSVVRAGKDYYMVHCCASTRGMLVWHSQDLVNWTPYSIIKVPIVGEIWAPDVDYVDGVFILYLPIMSPGTGTIWAMTAKSMKGPWTKPVDLGVHGIDPGLIVDTQANKYLYVDAGRAVPLTKDGLKVSGELKKVYDGWHFPQSWTVQCYCLESPKLIRHEKYYYLVSAEGGTDGPATSHMAAVARSESPLGPWENSPYNPLIHTSSRLERWWSQGHGILIDDVQGNWWMIYHAIENNYRSLGRQTLLMPITWTTDGWPRIKDDEAVTAMLHKPAGVNIGSGMALSDEFSDKRLGLQWSYKNITKEDEDITVGSDQLRLKGGGTTVEDSPLLWVSPVNHAYQAQVEVEVPENVQAGLVFAEGEEAPGITGGLVRNGELTMYVGGKQQLKVPWIGGHAFFKVVDLNHDISVFYSHDGMAWTRFDFGLESDGVTNVRVGLLANGTGTASFQHFVYRGLDSVGQSIQ